MPTSASLVTNLPADFNTFGQAVDTSMAQLKGGTTGQILSKTSATDMAFTWITNDVGDITAVTAGTGISGGGTSGAVTVTNSMATAITTAGDLIKGTGSGTFDRLGIGSSGQVLTVTAGAPAWATPSAAASFVGVYAQTTTIQTIANATYTVMNIGGTDVFDTNSFHDTTTNNSRVTIPSGKAGYYLIIGAIGWRDNGTGERQASLKLNGTIITIQPIFSSANAGSGNFTTNLVVYIANLAVSDYIEIQGRQYSGGNLGTEFVQLTAQYLGA